MEIVDRTDYRLIRLAGRLAEAQVPELLEAHAASVHVVRLNSLTARNATRRRV